MARWLLRHLHAVTLAAFAVWGGGVLAVELGHWRGITGGFGLLVASVVALVLLHAWVRWQREKWVREAPLPTYLRRKLRDTYPDLLPKDCELVERGLRQFFLASLRSGGKFVAMPSQVMDAMWHEFILNTRAYRDWCDLALGRFLHHTPAEALGGQAKGNDGLRRAWYWACRDEAIQPRTPSRLPLLFALDTKLAIPGGYHYLPDCRLGVRRDTGSSNTPYCGTDFSSDGYSGDADSFGGAEGSGSPSGDGGGGDGGDGGGGCGGGGD